MSEAYAPFFDGPPETQITHLSDITPELGGVSIAAYQARGFTPPFTLLNKQDVQSLLQASRDCAVKTASTDGWKTTGIEVEWGAQIFSSDHAINSFFGRQEFLQLAEKLAGQPVQPTPECWSSLCRPGEYIDPHKDWCGAVHLIVCGRAPAAPENGGSLVLEPDEAEVATEIFLTPGQAAAIDAKNLKHSTTPLRSTHSDATPLRYAWIARYFELGT